MAIMISYLNFTKKIKKEAKKDKKKDISSNS